MGSTPHDTAKTTTSDHHDDVSAARAALNDAARHRLRAVPGRWGLMGERTGLAWCAALLSYLAFTAYVAWPVVKAPARVMYGAVGDATGQVALIRYREALGVGPLSNARTMLENYPVGLTLPGSNTLPQILVEGPMQAIARITGGEEVLAYNIMMLVALVATPLAMFALTRFVVGGFWVPLLAGIAYGYAPWHMIRANGHASLTHIWALPLVVLGLIWVRRSGGWRPWLFTTVAIALAAYSNSYFTLAIGAIGAAFVVADVTASLWTRAGLRGPLARTGLLLVATLVVYTPQALWLRAHRDAIDNQLGGTRGPEDLYTYGARWWEWWVPHFDHMAFADVSFPFLLPRLHNSNFTEATLYLGLSVLSMTAVGAVVAWKARRRRGAPRFAALFAVSLMLCAALLAAPRTISPLGIELVMPSGVVHALFPYWRVYARLVMVVGIGAVLLAAIGLTWLRNRRRTPYARGAIAAVGAVLLFVDLSTGRAIYDTTSPPIYAALAAQGPGGRVEYPLTETYSMEHYGYILRTEDARHPLVNGAKPGTWESGLQIRLRDLNRPWVAPTLAWMGVPWVIVHGDTTGAAAPVPPVPAQMEEVARTPNARLLRVTAPAPQVLTVPGDGWGTPEQQPNGNWEQWLMGEQPVGQLRVQNSTGRTQPTTITTRLASFAVPRDVEVATSDGRVLVRARVQFAKRAVTFRYDAPPGDSQLIVRSPAPGTRVSDILHNTDPRVVSLRIGTISTRTPDQPPYVLG